MIDDFKTITESYYTSAMIHYNPGLNVIIITKEHNGKDYADDLVVFERLLSSYVINFADISLYTVFCIIRTCKIPFTDNNSFKTSG